MKVDFENQHFNGTFDVMTEKKKHFTYLNQCTKGLTQKPEQIRNYRNCLRNPTQTLFTQTKNTLRVSFDCYIKTDI